MACKHEIKIFGHKYSSISECLKEHGVDHNRVRSYMIKYNVTIEEAIEFHIHNYGDSLRRHNIMLNSPVEFCGVQYASLKDVLDKYELHDGYIRRHQVKTNMGYYDSLYSCILHKNYEVINSIGGFVSCKCKHCGGQFLFSPDLAVKHADECRRVSSIMIYFYQILISGLHLISEFKDYVDGRCGDYEDILRKFFVTMENRGLLSFTIRGKEYKSLNDFFRDYKVNFDDGKFVKRFNKG